MKVMVTGHRPNKLWGYDMSDSRYRKLKLLFKHILVDQCADEGISGMALGVDTIFAQAVLELKKEGYDIRLVCAIPCLNHDSKWFKSSQQEYQRILSLADEVVIVSKQNYYPALMQKRNEYMVDRSDYAIAVWDGTTGGTGNCMKYIYQTNTEHIIIKPEFIINQE